MLTERLRGWEAAMYLTVKVKRGLKIFLPFKFIGVTIRDQKANYLTILTWERLTIKWMSRVQKEQNDPRNTPQKLKDFSKNNFSIIQKGELAFSS